MSKTILIAGGSWGSGEWGAVPGATGPTAAGGIRHPGLGKYLLDWGYQVINLTQPGGSNKHSADRINSFLTCNQHLQIDCVIVFQIEWIRDLFVENRAIIADDINYGYHDLKNRIISRFYNYLSSASIGHNVPIYLIGSDSDTIWLDNFTKEYPGVHVSCQSLTNLLINNDHRNLDPVHCIFDPRDEEEIKHLKKHLDSADLELLLNDIDKGSQRVDTWANHKEYFYPDGFHANRAGHKVLFEFLKTQIPSL
jgi:hypothetical protein